jgi:hypothetical protein
MGKKGSKNQEKKRQQKAMKKRQKDNTRHKVRSTSVVSENSVQHQMLSSFGNVQNFVKNVVALSEMFKSDADLSKFRLDPDKVYEKIDMQAGRDALVDMYAEDDFMTYDEQYEEYWKEVRKDILEELISEDLVEQMKKTFDKLVLTKKGKKKEYRAVMAGKLLLESHIYSLTEAPVQDNALWEILFNAAIKENKKDLPEPAPEPEEGAAEETPAEAPAESAAEETPAEEPAAEEAAEEKEES